MLIRPSLVADIEAIARIYAHYVLTSSATFEVEPPDEAEMGARRRAVLERSLPYLVAEADGVVVGYAYATPYRPRPAYRFTVEDSVYVDPAHVGRGAGRLLLAELIRECERLGYRQMVAVIGGGDNGASIGLHRALGFEPAGVLRDVGYKFDRWIDTVRMQRKLGAGSATRPAP